jgi:hypothetical protein
MTGTAPCTLQALEGRQDGGMDVDQPVAPGLHESGCQKPHEAGQTDKFDIRLAERLVQTILKSGAVFKFTMVDDHGLNAAFLRYGKAGGIGPVGQDKGDFGGIVFGLGGVEERHHVAAASGNQNGGSGFRHAQDRRR